MPEAARKNDVTGHLGPLMDGPASSDVSIGDMPAWRAVPAGLGSGIEAASKAVKSLMDKPLLDPPTLPMELAKINAHLLQSAGAAASTGSPAAGGQVSGGFTKLVATTVKETATYASGAAVPGGEPAARLAFTLVMKDEIAGFVGDAISAIAAMTDLHNCPAPGVPPHGPGVVTKGSASVFINDLPAARKGDQLFEAAGGADPISMGCTTVFIGDAGGSTAASTAPAAEDVDEQAEERSQLQSIEAALVSAAESGLALIEMGPQCSRLPAVVEETHSTFALRVVDDETNEPFAGVSLIVTLPDGAEETHVTDANGEILIDDLDEPGTCDVRCDLEDAINDETVDFVRRE